MTGPATGDQGGAELELSSPIDESLIATRAKERFDGGVLVEVELWTDDVERNGWSNMAVDDWLLEVARRPVLRIYQWEPGWGSYGYFVPDAEAAKLLPGLRRVRRRTGGGVVDHRSDLTYTLVVPSGYPLADRRGGGSYKLIHSALSVVLGGMGADLRLSPSNAPSRGGDCFAQPVEFDLVDAADQKVAGAGQRRTASGLLHQGSVQCSPDAGFPLRLAHALGRQVLEFEGRPDAGEIECRASRYRQPAWATRR